MKTTLTRLLTCLLGVLLGVIGMDWWGVHQRGDSWPSDSAIIKHDPGKVSIETEQESPAPEGISIRSSSSPATKFRIRGTGPGFRRRNPAPKPPTEYGTQYALFIGINAYTKVTALDFAYNDARAVRDALREFGYEDEMCPFTPQCLPARKTSKPKTPRR